MTVSPGEQDKAWFLQYQPDADENTIEWFLERVSLRTESGYSSLQARNLTYSEFLSYKGIPWQ